MLNRLKLPINRKTSDAPAPSVDSEKKEPETGEVNVGDAERQGSIGFLDSSKGTDVPVEADAQRGVQKIEAATTAWTKWALVAILCKYDYQCRVYSDLAKICTASGSSSSPMACALLFSSAWFHM